MITSKGIIIVAKIIMKTKYRPLKWYFARPKPVNAERITVVMVTPEATMSEEGAGGGMMKGQTLDLAAHAN